MWAKKSRKNLKLMNNGWSKLAIQMFRKKIWFSSFWIKQKSNSLGLWLVGMTFHHLIQLLFSKCLKFNIIVIILILGPSYTLIFSLSLNVDYSQKNTKLKWIGVVFS